jgi:hypothetical protein
MRAPLIAELLDVMDLYLNASGCRLFSYQHIVVIDWYWPP